MKVWVTKYALTDGIIEAVAYKLTYRIYIVIPKYRGTKLGIIRLMNILDYTLSEKEAVKVSDEIRQNRIASLKKQIEKLEGMKFK